MIPWQHFVLGVCVISETSISTTAFTRRYGKPALFVLLGLLSLLVFYRDELFIFHPHSPDWNYYYGFRWFLIPHALGGLAALVLGPLQFSSRIRRNHLQFHRITGRMYVIGIAIAAIFAIAINVYHEPKELMWPTYTQSLLWLITTGAAFVHARARRIPQHKQWMVRSYCVTCIFVTVRVLVMLPWLAHISRANFASLLFTLQILAILGPDVGFNIQEKLAARKSSAQPARKLEVATVRVLSSQ